MTSPFNIYKHEQKVDLDIADTCKIIGKVTKTEFIRLNQSKDNREKPYGGGGGGTRGALPHGKSVSMLN